MAYNFGPKLASRIERLGGPGLAEALQTALGAYQLPSAMGKDDVFGMSDLRGLLRFGGDMGIDPTTMSLLQMALPNFNNEKWRPGKQNMPQFYRQWAEGRGAPTGGQPDPTQPPPGQPPPGQSPPAGVNPGYRGVDAPQPGRDPRGQRRMGGGGYQSAPVDQTANGGFTPPPPGPAGPPLIGGPTYGPYPTMGGSGRPISPHGGSGLLGGKNQPRPAMPGAPPGWSQGPAAPGGYGSRMPTFQPVGGRSGPRRWG